MTHLDRAGTSNRFVWVRCSDATYVGVYLSPNKAITVFRNILEGLEDSIREISGTIVVVDYDTRRIGKNTDHQFRRTRHSSVYLR